MTSAKGKLIIKGGRLVDPENNLEGKLDLLIEDGKIAAVDKPGAFASSADAQTVDAAGLLVLPGLVDLHVHLREPGYEWKETVATGSAAAVAGGFTSICCMPNTNPAVDKAQVVEYILDRARAADKARVLPIGAITIGRQGKALAPMAELREAGCVAFSDDGAPVWHSGIMRRALEYSLMFDAVLACHEEDLHMAEGWSMHEGVMSLKMGLKGFPGAAEDVMIARDIELARLTGGRVHFCHVTTARAALLIKRAKEDGIPVTAETCAHYFTLADTDIGEYDTNRKMSMPLRSEPDRAAIMEALATGVIDCIASDHAPHEADSKNKEFCEASMGIVGLQTTLPLTLAKVREGKISLRRAVEAMTSAPARCFKLSAPCFSKGAAADLVLVDENRSTVLTPKCLHSKSKNSPWLGEKLQGLAVKTFVGGKEVYSAPDEAAAK